MSQSLNENAHAEGAAIPQEQKSIMNADLSNALDAEGSLTPDYDLTVPKGMELNDNQRNTFMRQAKELGLNGQTAQKLLEISHNNMESNKQAHQEQVAAWEQELRKDRQLGGQSFESTVAYAKAGLQRFDPSGELLTILDQTGYGNNPHVIRFLQAVGKAHAEDSVVLGATNHGKKPRHERLYGKYNNL